jgi:hypothetical protein
MCFCSLLPMPRNITPLTSVGIFYSTPGLPERWICLVNLLIDNININTLPDMCEERIVEKLSNNRTHGRLLFHRNVLVIVLYRIFIVGTLLAFCISDSSNAMASTICKCLINH